MKNEKVSIIISIYNSAIFLPELLNSICHQTFNNYEVLLINDGSTDNSEEICLAFVKNNKKLKYYKKENSGVSDSRNFGIEKAKGKYLCFVDSDDILSYTYLEDLVLAINKNNTDMACCDFCEFKNFNEIKNIPVNDDINNIKIYDKNKYNILFSQYRGYLWNKIFLKEKIDKNNLRFNKEILMAEDMLFIYKYLSYCKKIAIIRKVEYFYRVIDSSASKSLSNTKWFSIYKVFDFMLDNNINDYDFNQSLIYSYIHYIYQGMFRLKFLEDNSLATILLSDIDNRKNNIKNLKKKLKFKLKIKIDLYKILYNQIFTYKYKRRK